MTFQPFILTAVAYDRDAKSPWAQFSGGTPRRIIVANTFLAQEDRSGTYGGRAVIHYDGVRFLVKETIEEIANLVDARAVVSE